ncbi:uncharacterized protein LOC107849471 [Capsicum annuum]|uniref:uncharacterized protein LOC107849471 n=1 Tax=Capsicum annuum TaxID=4072 RepID=UPI001FB0F85E|nr:uncharacterized protein LOC107849471 [Capsicum annuum]
MVKRQRKNKSVLSNQIPKAIQKKKNPDIQIEAPKMRDHQQKKNKSVLSNQILKGQTIVEPSKKAKLMDIVELDQVQVLSSRFDSDSSGTLFYILCCGESSCSEDVMSVVGFTELFTF